MKKIAIIYSGAKSWGGIETYLEQFFKYADKSKIDLTLLSLGEWPLTDKFRISNFKFRIFSGQRIRFKTIFDLKKYVLENNIDLIVSQGTVANAYARAVSWLTKIPSLVTIHSVREFDYINPFIAGFYGLVERFTRFQTSRYVAVSEFIKGKLVNSGVAAEKIKVIYNGVVLNSKFEIQNSKLGKPQLVIGSIGRLHHVKNYHNLILAYSLLSATDYQLNIYGDGDERETLERLICERGLSGRVKLCGSSNGPEEALAEIDIYIQPSLMEGFGISVVEAMLAGKPVIVTPVGSLPELVTDGKTGIIAGGTNPEALAAAINLLISNPELAKEIAEAGKKSAKERFSIEKWIRETEKFYLGAIK